MKKFMWFLLLFCSPAWTYAQNYPLYVTDGKSLSRIDLNTQTKTKIGDFPAPLGTPTPVGTFLEPLLRLDTPCPLCIRRR